MVVRDPGRKIIMVYHFEHMTPAAFYRFHDKIKSGIYDCLEIDFGKIVPD